MTSEAPEAHFVSGPRGRLFVIKRGPKRAKAVVLIVPPFAEEMNKSRRMITEVACELARRGVASLTVDLFGTGDSEGEFGDATWEGWVGDLLAVDEWSAARGAAVTDLLAVRLGCALAAAYAMRGRQSQSRWVFWQPVVDGARYMDQFLRLKLASGLHGDGKKLTVADLRQEILSAGSLEVAGYDLSTELVSEIDAIRLGEQGADRWPELHLFDLVRGEGAPMSVPTSKFVDRLRGLGCDVRQRSVVCPPIWTTTEIVVCADLGEVTVQALSS